MSSRPLIALTLMLTAAGCHADAGESEQTSVAVPQRDLTLQQAAAPDSEVISPLEAGRVSAARSVEPGGRPMRRAEERLRAVTRKSTVAAAPATSAPAPASAVAPSSSLPAPAALAAPAESGAASESPADADDPYALAPGATVTSIPASQAGGAPGGVDGWSDQPSVPLHGQPTGDGHGGRRRGRGH